MFSSQLFPIIIDSADLPSLKRTQLHTWKIGLLLPGRENEHGANIRMFSKEMPKIFRKKNWSLPLQNFHHSKKPSQPIPAYLSKWRYQWNITSFLVGNAATQLCLDFQAAILVSQDFCWCISAVTSSHICASILAPTTTVQYHIYHVYLFLFFPAEVDCL